MKITTKKHDNKYEYGAYFKYNDLYKALLNLIPILSSNRFGKDGIFFQTNENKNESIILSPKEKSPIKINSSIKNLHRDNYPILLSKDKYRKHKILLPSLTSPIKLEKNSSNFNKSNYTNFISNLKKKEQIDKYNISSLNELDEKKGRNYNQIFRNKSSYSFMKYKEEYYDKFFYDQKKYLEKLNNSKNKKNENDSFKNSFPLSNESIKKIKIKIPKNFRLKFNSKKINFNSFINKSPKKKFKIINHN